MPITAQTTPAPRFFGTTMVRAAFALALFGWGIGFYGPPIYLHAVVERTGWPLTLISAAVTTHFLSGVLVVVNLPRLHARAGLPASIVGGAIVAALGVWGWAVASQPWQLFIAATLSGMGWVTMGAVAVNAVVSPWFVRTRPTALAKAYNGASIGGVVLSPLWVAMIAWLGFAGAAAVVGGLVVVVMVVLARRVFVHTPQSRSQHADGDAVAVATTTAARVERPALPGALLWRNRAFLTLASGMALGLFAQIGLLAHLYSLLVPPLGSQWAGVVMGGATAVAILGRSAAATLLARGGNRRVVAASGYAIQLTGSMMLSTLMPGQTGLLLLGVALFGLGIGNVTSLPPLVAQGEFATQDVPRVVALIVGIGQAIYAFAPAIFAAVLALSGATQGGGIGERSSALFLLAACIQLAAAAAFLAGRPRRSRPA